MNRMLMMIISAVLLVSGCSDNNDSASNQAEPSMVDKAMKSTGDAMDNVADAANDAMDNAADATNDAMDATADMAVDVADTVSDAANDAADGASEMASGTMDAVSDGADGAMDKAADMVPGAAAAGAMSDGGASGQQVYQQSCQACHATGAAGAPKTGDKDVWAPRIATGMDALVASAINGKGIMPPKGTCASCSDDDLKAAVEYMVSQSQ